MGGGGIRDLLSHLRPSAGAEADADARGAARGGHLQLATLRVSPEALGASIPEATTCAGGMFAPEAIIMRRDHFH